MNHNSTIVRTTCVALTASHHFCNVSKLASSAAPLPANCWLRFHATRCSSRKLDWISVRRWHVL